MQTPLRFPQNALTFRVKRKGVLCEMHLRFLGSLFHVTNFFHKIWKVIFINVTLYLLEFSI